MSKFLNQIHTRIAQKKKRTASVGVDVDALKHYYRIHGIDEAKANNQAWSIAVPRFLDLFAKHEIKATFYCVAEDLAEYPENIDLIKRIANKYEVDPFIFVTIAGVESNYGVHHSQYSVFNSLYTQIIEMPRRAKWASKELAEFLEYCYEDQMDTQEIGGSYAGAFGFGQFIPSSFNNYSVDFNEDGIREPYAWPDVLASIANYLRKNGYKANSKDYKKGGSIWKSIFAYNRSDNYVMAVLELTEEIRKRVG